MTRINVYTETGDFAGWFDSDSAEWIQENKDWDGRNHVGRVSGLQAGYQGLYRMGNGRWVLRHNARSEYNGPDYAHFITDKRAREWLLRNESDDIVETYFGEIEAERGPGRPEIGPAINVRFEQAMLNEIDGQAKANGLSRAAMIRKLVAAGL